MQSDARPALLIVDDEPDVLLSLKSLLRRDFELHTANSADEALQILASQDIHIVMTDHRMPGMSGSELLQRVQKEFPNTVRLLFTGYADIRAVIDAINTGGLFKYITKPWDPDDLIETLHQAAHCYRKQQQLRNLADDILSFTDAAAEELKKCNSESAASLQVRGSSLVQRARDLLR